MQAPDELVALKRSAYQAQAAMAGFVRSNGPVVGWSAEVREGATRRQRSLQEAGRALHDAVQSFVRTEEEARELRRAPRLQVGASLAGQDPDQSRTEGGSATP
ncbi:hypothetical protein KNE206_04320 [Kitasatospora sp. NE20-6]